MSRRSEEKALRKAAEGGDLHSALALAQTFEEDGDKASAEGWYRFAAMRDDLDGAAELGRMLCQRGEFGEAEPWLRKATASDDQQTAQYGAAVLGMCLRELDRDDEAEQWLIIGADAGIDFAVDALEKLRKERAGGGRGSGSDVLQTFEVAFVMFYDGSGHRLGRSVCTLTRTRLIIEDARGGISQIQVRDINRVRTMLRKTLRVEAPGVAYDIDCVSKDQKNQLEAWLSKAIRGV